jgi:hypothetical protein
VARAAKQTARSEARRKYRQAAAAQMEEGDAQELDYGERKTDLGTDARPKRAAADTGRPGFGAAFRQAYHPANLREDFRRLPEILGSRAFLAAVALVIAGGIAWYAFPVYTGSAVFWELLVVPGSALAPQLVAGFFAKRGSYIMGFVIGMLQPLVYVLVNTSARVQEAYAIVQPGGVPATPADQLLTAMVSSAVTGTLFAAAAAWYRRFLNLSSPRRQAAAQQRNRRAATRDATRKPAGR